jgi:hypothetical protein
MDTYHLEQALDREAAKIKGGALRTEIANMIDSAAVNAVDTCQEQGIERDDVDYNARRALWFKSTLESITTFSETSEAARRWFARRGVIG